MTTAIGRHQLGNPAYNEPANGTQLFDEVTAMFTKISDAQSARYNVFAAQANSSVLTITHNFGIAFAQLKVMLFSGTHPTLTRITNLTGYTIIANATNPNTQVDITFPSSGGPFSGAVIIAQGKGVENLTDLGDTTLASLVDGQYLIYDSTTSKWINSHPKWTSETATVTSGTLTPTSTRPSQRITT